MQSEFQKSQAALKRSKQDGVITTVLTIALAVPLFIGIVKQLG